MKKTIFENIVLFLFCAVVVKSIIILIYYGYYILSLFVYLYIGVMIWIFGIAYNIRISLFVILLWLPALWINKVFNWLVRKKDGA